MFSKFLIFSLVGLLAACNGKDDTVDDTGADDSGGDDSGTDDTAIDDTAIDDTGDCVPADEVCDGVDNDCDGDVDEDVQSTYYADADADDYGDLANSVLACTATPGWVSEAGDCDDNDAGVHPGVDEICDDVDNDCDLSIDEDAIDAATWYTDLDMDGYGADDATTVSCEAPPGTAPFGGDCDDEDAAYNPGAEEIDCEDPNDYNCDGSVGFDDADGDGYAACEECDDGDISINPDASELCDGVDNDCDSTVDEDDAIDAATWYGDMDGDGYGDATDTTLACDAPEDYVADDTDCDDTFDTTYPGAPELCDGEDNDCDSDVDEEVSDGETWYADADSDGFGDPTSSMEACDLPDGYVADDTDCDDGDDAVNPDADEVCDDEDNNCDGIVDEDSAVDAGTFYADTDDDGYGDDGDTVTACDAPTGYSALGGDCDDTDSAYNPGADEADCEDPADYNCDGSTGYADDDGDGYAACEDCDDLDDAINVDATELCDGVDNNCDTVVDEDSAADAGTFYADSDDDGYGDASDSTDSCEAPAGYTDDDTDCDDGDDAVNPGADEVCDAADVDEDCDGDADDDDSSVTGTTDYYTDGDGDGFGDDGATASACDAPSGSVDVGGDCDDGDDTINPDALELCDAADVDEDCDGLINADDDSATGLSSYYADVDGDGFGDAATTVLACGLEDGTSDNGDDCDDADGSTYPGAAELCDDGAVNDCDGSVADAADACRLDGDMDMSVADARRFGESTSHGLGYAIAGGDIDGDGLTDALASGPEIASKGRVYLFLGALSGDKAASAYDARIGAETTGDELGHALSSGDVDGDGYADIAVSAIRDDDTARDAGAAYLVLGPVSGDVTSVATVASVKLVGSAADDTAGSAVSASGDIDGDGNTDLAVGSTGDDTAGSGAGAIFLTYGPGSSGALSASDVVLTGSSRGAGAGGALAKGDLDGDGLADLVIGEYKGDTSGTDAGAAYVFFGAPSSGSVTDADWILLGAAAGDYAGYALAANGDVDGDGTMDLLVGSPKYDGVSTNGGAGWLLLGGTGASGSSTLSSSVAEAVLGGHKSSGGVGTSVALVDLDGDDSAEIALGAPDVKFASVALGGVFLSYGPVSGSVSTASVDATLMGENSGDMAGYSLRGVGDTDGDGLGDLLIGIPGRDRGTHTDAGALYLLQGSTY